MPSNMRALKLLIALLVATAIAACGGAADPKEASKAPTAPNVPAIASNGKLKIFILAGQSNMVGFGKVELGADMTKATHTPHIFGGPGSLRFMVNNDPVAYGYLVNPNKTVTYTIKADAATGAPAVSQTYPSWVVRDDVWVSSWDSGEIGKATERRNGALSVGFGSENVLPAGYIGPEFGFGHVVGNGLDDKVLLIKASWGGKSLAVDFRPPSSVGLGVGSPTSITTPDTTGIYYTELLSKVRLVLSDIKKYYPAYDGKGYEVVGMGWHQGWNDRVTTSYVAQYEINLANLIRDLRKDLELPNMLFVIGNTGLAWADKDANGLKLINAQASVVDPIKYPKFAGNVSTVDTRPFHYPDTSPEVGFIHHWNYNGQSYFKVGESMGSAMLKLMKQ
jgi:Carbohydrate esterase, sialic acid-specific acetylesterase